MRISNQTSFIRGMTLFILTLSMLGCASGPSERQPVTGYAKTINKFSAGHEVYEGFVNKFAFRATMLNFPVQDELLNRLAELYDWTPERIQQEKEKKYDEMRDETKIFMSFYVPEPKYDNLLDTKKIWETYLVVDGTRYEATVKKDSRLLAELVRLYPYHNRWSSPYILTFSLPTRVAQSSNAQLTVTGPLGSQTVEFSPVVSAVQ